MHTHTCTPRTHVHTHVHKHTHTHHIYIQGLAVSVRLRALSTCIFELYDSLFSFVFIRHHHAHVIILSQRLITSILPTQGARFTTLSKALRSPRSHYLLLPVLARATRTLIKCPARHLLLDLVKENMIERHPPEEGWSERQCAGAQEEHIKDAQPNTCNKDMELASLILTHLQHWRGQIIPAHARAPRCAYRHIQPRRRRGRRSPQASRICA